MKQLPLVTMVAALACAQSAQADLIFSEYIEGSSNNKALELLNTGSDSLDLSAYTVELYSNGNLTAGNTLPLSGTLDAGKVLVIANPSAAPAILAVSDMTSSVTYFNGNDAVLLRHGDNVVDRIGEVGNNAYFASNVTLVRNEGIVSGDPQFDMPFDANEQWTAYPIDTFEYLGNEDGDEPEPPVEVSCAAPATPISTIQGSGNESPLLGEKVQVEAVVVADLQQSDEMRGFFLQEEILDLDADPGTSEGIFVYFNDQDVNFGDTVRVLATVDEYYGLTQLGQVEQLVVCASGSTIPTAATIELPLSDADSLEAIEGMRVTVAGEVTVNEVYNLGRYGEFLIAKGRRFIPTDIALPGDDAAAVAAQNRLNQLIVEDGIRTQNPDPLRFPAPELSAYNSLRVGDTVDNLTGVLNYSYGAYKLIPTGDPIFNGSNARTEAPAVHEDANLRVASFNVLNFFNGDGQGDGFPTPRGADSELELQRQTQKLVAAITAMDADIVGLMELENDGFDEFSAVAELVAALNNELGEDDIYHYINPRLAGIGDDAIAVGMLYRPATVTPVNAARILTSQNSPLDDDGIALFNDDLNRPALLQSFATKDGHDISVVVNHFKSKGSSNCEDVDDCDVGQGAYNLNRTRAAEGLARWLQSDPTGSGHSNIVILGDLNAYRMEDPLQTLASFGYQELSDADSYSYVYSGESGSLDHALVSAPLTGQVLGHHVWHINADEPRVLDYNVEFKSDFQVESLYAPNAYRASDHDPVIVDLDLNNPPEAAFHSFRFLGFYVFVSDSTDDGGVEALDHQWQIGNLTLEGDWTYVSMGHLQRYKLTEATLTVTDRQGRSDSVTNRFR